jgi:hypothetical protein
MSKPLYPTLIVALNPTTIAARLASLDVTNELAAERDRARQERDAARRQVQTLETQLRVAINERDDARALGRMA